GGGAAPGAGAAGGSSPAAPLAGSNTVNTLPCPGVDRTVTVPPYPFTIPSTSGSPRPRPWNLVVKKGSKIRDCVAASIPLPLSVTLIDTYFGPPASRGTTASRESSG